MKINLIPTKKLALLSAVFCAAMLAFSPNAKALAFDDANDLGTVFNGPFTPGDELRTTWVNHLISMAPNTSGPFLGVGFIRGGANPGPGFPNYPTAVFDHNGTGTTVSLGAGGTYSYLFAEYRDDELVAESEVWYVGNLSGDVTIPSERFTFPLTGWTLFTAGGQGVPDGGTTVMLLGTALGALGMARRFLKA